MSLADCLIAPPMLRHVNPLDSTQVQPLPCPLAPGPWPRKPAALPCAPPPRCLKVAVRVRPPNAQELARGDAQALFVNPVDHRQVSAAHLAPASRPCTASLRGVVYLRRCFDGAGAG